MASAPEPAPTYQFQNPPPPRKSNALKIVLIVLASVFVLFAPSSERLASRPS
jgi:hypothetical protein